MAFYTKINKKKTIKNLKNFNILKPNIKGIKEGTTNSNYIIKTKNKKFILTIIEDKSKYKKYVILFQNFLYLKNFKVPFFLKNNKGKSIFYTKKKESLITSFLKGKKLSKINLKNCYYLGIEMYKMHESFFLFKKKNEMNSFKIFEIFKKIKKKIPKKFLYFLENEFSKDINFEKFMLNKKNIYKNCHCDIFPDNVFFLKNKVSGIFDFYYYSSENKLFDIAIIFCEWCFEKKINYSKFKYFIYGYFFKKPSFFKINNLIFYIRKISIRFMITRFLNFNKKFCNNKNPYRYLKIILFIEKKHKDIKKNIKKIFKEYNEKFYN
ncbi:phosphotransferase [Candidatus Vidania fulgoroideorum]